MCIDWRRHGQLVDPCFCRLRNLEKHNDCWIIVRVRWKHFSWSDESTEGKGMPMVINRGDKVHLPQKVNERQPQQENCGMHQIRQMISRNHTLEDVEICHDFVLRYLLTTQFIFHNKPDKTFMKLSQNIMTGCRARYQLNWTLKIIFKMKVPFIFNLCVSIVIYGGLSDNHDKPKIRGLHTFLQLMSHIVNPFRKNFPVSDGHSCFKCLWWPQIPFIMEFHVSSK